MTETVHVYDAGDKWRKVAELQRPDADEWDRYGYAVGVAGDALAVAATGRGDRRNADRPVVYVYGRTSDGWTLEDDLRPEFPTAHAGTSDLEALALAGDTLALGNLVGEDAARFVVVYERDGDGWTQRATLRPDSLVEAGAFGEAVELHEGTLVATAPRAELDGDAGVMGSAFRYDRSSAGWTHTERFSNSDVVEPGRFGVAAGLSADRIAVGGRIRRENLTDRPAVYVWPR